MLACNQYETAAAWWVQSGFNTNHVYQLIYLNQKMELIIFCISQFTINMNLFLNELIITNNCLSFQYYMFMFYGGHVMTDAGISETVDELRTGKTNDLNFVTTHACPQYWYLYMPALWIICSGQKKTSLFFSLAMQRQHKQPVFENTT